MRTLPTSTARCGARRCAASPGARFSCIAISMRRICCGATGARGSPASASSTSRMRWPAYDVVSLLEDARRDVAPELAQAMTEYYLAKSRDNGVRLDQEQFRLTA